MRKDLKVIALIYLGVAVLAYALTVRVERLSSTEDTVNQNKSIVLKIR